MYGPVKRISILKGLASDGVVISPGSWSWYQLVRKSSGLMEEKAEAPGDVTDEISFTSFLQQRQEQARRSMIVQVSKQKSCAQLANFCKNFGGINKIIHYQQQSVAQFLVIEMCREEDLNNLLKCALGLQHFGKSDNFLVHNVKPVQVTPNSLTDINIEYNVQTKVNLNGMLKEPKMKSHSLTEIINFHYESKKVNDLGMRLRFLMCRQIECLLSGLLPNAVVYPFGSSITGFGMNGCDLDVVVLLEDTSKDSFLVFEKNYNTSDRGMMQDHLGIISTVMKNFLTGCKGVLYIKGAKVPIIKFRSDFTLLDCDLSMYNTHGVSMSQMLYVLTRLDQRVKPFIFFLKVWANKVGLISKNPGQSISNFILTLFGIFFLQQSGTSKGPVLPPWNIFPPGRHFLLTDSEVMIGVNAFKRKFEVNDCSLEELLLNFFKYFSKFDFGFHGVSLNTGSICENAERCPMYIENPLIPNINVSKNISMFETKKFQDFVRVAAQILGVEKSNPDRSLVFQELLQSENYKSNSASKVRKLQNKSNVNILDVLRKT